MQQIQEKISTENEEKHETSEKAQCSRISENKDFCELRCVRRKLDFNEESGSRKQQLIRQFLLDDIVEKEDKQSITVLEIPEKCEQIHIKLRKRPIMRLM